MKSKKWREERQPVLDQLAKTLEIAGCAVENISIDPAGEEVAVIFKDPMQVVLVDIKGCDSPARMLQAVLRNQEFVGRIGWR